MSAVRTTELVLARREPLVNVLTRAFVDDPAWVSLGHPSKPRRERVMRLTFAGEVRRARRWASHSRAALADDDSALGVAIAYPSAVGRKAHWSSVFELAALMGGPGAFIRGCQLNAAAERFHPTSPHVHLALLAVDPPHQRAGIGSALVEGVLCASAGSSVYLEVTRADNVPFYEAFGFELLGEAALPRGERLWALGRGPD